MKKICLVFLLLSVSFQLVSKDISTKKALLFSALLPGGGELYLQEYNKAAVFLSVEFATILTYFRMKQETDWAIASYKQFAFAETNVPKDRDDSYYQLIQNYSSSSSYNASILRDARNYYLIYQNDPEGYQEYLDQYLVPDEYAWDWEDSKTWDKYRKLRREKQDWEIYTKFTFAAAILNRIISVIDSAISARDQKREQSKLSNLHILPDLQKGGLEIHYEIKF